MSNIETWLERLGYVGDKSTLDRTSSLGSRPYAAEITDMLSGSRGIGATNVYCVDDVPVVCFVEAANFWHEERAKALRAACRKIWNQGLATVLVAIDGNSLSAYSILRPEDSPETLRLEEASETGRWSPYDIDTSNVQQRLPRWFEPDRRVDRRLLKNLTDVVTLLEGEGLSRPIAEALMAQVIFVRYLEVRGIVGDNYRTKYRLRPLPALIAKQDGRKIDRLLLRLGKTFNGDFLNWSGDGPPPWHGLKIGMFKQIERFLAGEELETAQTNFWGYDFGIIPVELISGIYESFLADRQKKQGAYYTPRHLATLTVEQAFQGIEKPQKARVYDGACGSGILLTTAFQKMLAAAESNANRRLRFSERVKLMQAQLFGSDIDPTACWITAFSLCLCLLDRLTPSDIEVLQKGGKYKLPVLLANDQAEGNLHGGPERGDFFSDSNALAVQSNWDVVLSNPPWKEQTGKSQAEFEIWVDNHLPEAHVPDRQLAAAYAFRAALCAKATGRIALILPLNLVIGTESLNFRQDLLSIMRIERIINFADLRFLLFPKAHNACALVIGQPRLVQDGPLFEPNERIEYWTPKTDTSLSLGRIAISTEDRSWVSPLEVYEKRSTLIRRYWSSSRDLALIERLESMGTIQSTLLEQEWIANKGFHATDNNNPNYDLKDRDWRWLGSLPFLPTKEIPKDHPVIASDTQMSKVSEKFKTVATPGGGSGELRGPLYGGSRVVWPNGLSPELRVRAVFTDRPFAFQHTTCAVGGRDSDRATFQLLTAYLRSPLATYLLISNSYSLIADRNAVSKDEILTLPFAHPNKHPDPKLAKQIVVKIGRIFDKLIDTPEWQRAQAFISKGSALDELIADYFGLTEFERSLVADAADILAPSIQPRSYSNIRTSLRSCPDSKQIQNYCEILSKSLSQWSVSRGGQGKFATEAIIGSKSDLFCAVRLSLSTNRISPKNSKESKEELYAILTQISDRENLPKSAALLIPDLIVADESHIYLIKPMQRRFWLSKAAFADAERIVISIDTLGRKNLWIEKH
jgi:hypothetical protein